MAFLCFDLSSGGLSAALFDIHLKPIRIVKSEWGLAMDDAGAAVLSVDDVIRRFRQAIQNLGIREELNGISIGSFMHNFVLLDAAERPLTPVFTWLDRQGESGVEYIRTRMGDQFHLRTGCRFHAMFPVFKLAALRIAASDVLDRAAHIVSIKSYLVRRLTGVWMEDYGMASASGLFNIKDNDWDETIVAIAGIRRAALPQVRERWELAGPVTAEAAAGFGLREGTPVVNASGDGFLAHAGSGCGAGAAMVSVSLGTSAVARRASAEPVLDIPAGTFCYKQSGHSYLLGCASSNGGNVLDWGRSIFGEHASLQTGSDIPIFIPLLYGERSPEWNASLTGSWHGLKPHHTARELGQSILEGVIFNLACLVEILNAAARSRASGIVLSGNGFRHPLAASLFATVSGEAVWLPPEPGLASLRGAAVCILEAMGQPVPSFEAVKIEPQHGEPVMSRYQKYRELR